MISLLRSRKAVVALALAGMLGGCGAANPRVATRLNDEAAVAGDLPLKPLSGKVITSWVDRSSGRTPAMSTLYGNDVAVRFARGDAGHAYPVGSVLSLVSWSQQEDGRWFGGNIPAATQSVEIVTIGAALYRYQRFEGKPLKLVTMEEDSKPNAPSLNLLERRAAVMP